MGTVIIIAYGLLALGILVLVHELGHFSFAKLFKVKVEEFSIGFGDTPLKFKKGETLYKIGYIPLGGYCKMAGEEPGQNLSGNPDELYSKPPLQRLAIIFAGPAFNYIFGIIVFIVLMLTGIKHVTFNNKIQVLDTIKVNNKSIVSPAKAGGLKTGDIITAVNGIAAHNWDDIRNQIITSGDSRMNKITVQRYGRIKVMDIKPVIDPETGASQIGIIAYMNNTVADVIGNDPAAKAGIKAGDTIIKLDNKNVNSFSEIKPYIASRPDKNIAIVIKRDKALLNKTIRTRSLTNTGFIGLVLNTETVSYTIKARNIFQGIKGGIRESNTVIMNIIYSLKTLFSGKVKVKSALAGPPRIIYMLGEMAQQSEYLAYIRFIAFISIALAFFNLLPIPAVDGSYILIFLFEFVIRRKFSMKEIRFIQTVQYAGFLILLGLLFLVSYNDIINLIHHQKLVIDYFNGIIV